MNEKPPSESQRRIIWFALTALALAVLVAVIVAFVWGIGELLGLLSPVLWPLAIAAVLSYLLDPAVNWLEHHRVSRAWGIVIVFVAGLLIFGGILASVIPQLVQETNALVSKIPRYTATAQQRFEHWANTGPEGGVSAPTNQASKASNPKSPPPKTAPQTALATNAPPSGVGNARIHQQLVSSAKSWLGKAMPRLGQWLLGLLSKASSLVDVAIAIILIPIYTFYFLREKREIKTQWTNYLPIRDSRMKDEIIFILSAINQYMITFFRGQVLVALISGALYTIGYLAMGLDYAFLLGFTAFILVIVPYVGAIANGIIAMILTAVQFGDWLHPLLVVVVFAVVQSLESFFYSPRIMGHRVGMHPVVVIIALMVGITMLGGFLGGILAIPLAAALRVLLFRYVWKKSREEGLEQS